MSIFKKSVLFIIITLVFWISCITLRISKEAISLKQLEVSALQATPSDEAVLQKVFWDNMSEALDYTSFGSIVIYLALGGYIILNKKDKGNNAKTTKETKEEK